MATKLPARDPVSISTWTLFLGWLGCDTWETVAVRKSADEGLVRAPKMEDGITTSVKLTADDILLVFFKLFCLVTGLDGPSGTAEADAVAEEEEDEEEVGGTYTPLATDASGYSFFSFLNALLLAYALSEELK